MSRTRFPLDLNLPKSRRFNPFAWVWRRRYLRYPMLLGVLGASLYVALWLMIWQHARTVLTHPPTQVADVAMVFGNRAYLNGAPNPCLTGRVDEGVRLADNGLANALLFSGGRDIEDNRVEAQVMETHARAQGYVGEVWREEASRSSLENMQLSAAIVSEKKARSVILVSEPYHLWRIQRLVERGYLGEGLTVQYAAAPSYCWNTWGMFFKGSLREPLAVVANFISGYY